MVLKKPIFSRYLGIDYSGAQTADAGLKGIRVYEASWTFEPQEVLPPADQGKYWSRRSLAQWLETQLGGDEPTLVGIDHGFSFPWRYFEAYGLAHDWSLFLDDFHQHWPCDVAHTRVECIRRGLVGKGQARCGNARWRRLTEQRVGAKSVFHFDVPGSVAKSTHAGLPWLRYLRHQLGKKIHFWPFDGWDIPARTSALAEIYPSLWHNNTPLEGRTPDQQDAYVAAAWLKQVDEDGSLEKYLKPNLQPDEYAMARIEGWILGVV